MVLIRITHGANVQANRSRLTLMSPLLGGLLEDIGPGRVRELTLDGRTPEAAIGLGQIVGSKSRNEYHYVAVKEFSGMAPENRLALYGALDQYNFDEAMQAIRAHVRWGARAAPADQRSALELAAFGIGAGLAGAFGLESNIAASFSADPPSPAHPCLVELCLLLERAGPNVLVLGDRREGGYEYMFGCVVGRIPQPLGSRTLPGRTGMWLRLYAQRSIARGQAAKWVMVAFPGPARGDEVTIHPRGDWIGDEFNYDVDPDDCDSEEDEGVLFPEEVCVFRSRLSVCKKILGECTAVNIVVKQGGKVLFRAPEVESYELRSCIIPVG